jgi:pantothenate kinase
MASMLDRLVQHLRHITAAAQQTGRRHLVGITGCPGSGKSTLATRLAEATSAAVVHMDGFHLMNGELNRRGLRPRKGSPRTFDVPLFVALLHQLRAGGAVKAPIYSRELHEPVPDAVTIAAEARVVIVEGNYLLLDEHPWSQVRPLLDEVWYLDVPLETCMTRVLERHIRGGLAPEEAAKKIETNDRLNAAIVESTRPRADRVIQLDTLSA